MSEGDERWTCGNGLAAHATIPAKLAELLGSLADNLAAHIPTIDISDGNGRMEREAYVGLSAEYAAIAERLAATAERMRGYHDLPAADHHEDALSTPELLRAFQEFVALQKELADLLTMSAEGGRQLAERQPGGTTR